LGLRPHIHNALRFTFYVLRMDGIFNIDKPQGLTSHDVVARVRRIIRAHLALSIQNPKSKIQNRVGHAGTLDPIATGVLPVVVGKATRLVEYLSDADKAYRATLVLGATTDTYDREGTIMPVEGAEMPTRTQVEAALDAFRGEIEQLPPMHSAIKVGGKKLYELARAGVEIERKPRRITIHRLDLEAYRPPVMVIYVECSKGTYIRSLAHDLGAALGTGAYLDALVRTQHGPFTLEGATTLEGLEEAFREGTWQESLYLPEFILAAWETHIASPEEAKAITQGKPLQLPPPQLGARDSIVAKTDAGELLAILSWHADRGFWQPKKVFVAHDR
jgi:tRNA pseudouridine55 synthase